MDPEDNKQRLLPSSKDSVWIVYGAVYFTMPGRLMKLLVVTQILMSIRIWPAAASSIPRADPDRSGAGDQEETGEMTTVGDSTGTMLMDYMGGDDRIDVRYPYWIAGTAFPCSALDECTYIVNGTDTFGGEDPNAGYHEVVEQTDPCIVSNHVRLSKNWYGYTGRFRMRAHEGAKFYYHVVYPEEDCCIKLLLYLEQQVNELRYHMSCIQMQSVLDITSPQVINLSPNSPTSGCKVNVTANGDRVVDCFSGRILSSDIERDWYIAASSCGSPDGLHFQYSLYIYGWVASNDTDCPNTSQLSSASTLRLHSWAGLLTLLAGKTLLLRS